MIYDISLVPCASYEEEEVTRALEEALEPIGGLECIPDGCTVAIKANLVSAMKPEEAATTHPALLCALARMLKKKNCRVILGDSPGGLYTAAHLNHIYKVTGMTALTECGVELNQNFGQSEAKFPEAVKAHDFLYTSYLDEADCIINFCKLKSHGMMGMSAAAKNLFGTVPGTVKPEYHFRFPKHEDFADMIVDLDEYFKPVLNLCDAVVGMEGNGPTAGIPRKIGALLASRSPHQLDLLAARLIGLTPSDVPTLEAAIRRGLIPADADEMNIFGFPDEFLVKDFDNIPVSRHRDLKFSSGEGLFAKAKAAVLSRALTAVPMPDNKICIACHKCGDICPAHAITMKGVRVTSRAPATGEAGKTKKAVAHPHINRDLCIRCFCCQEFCPVGAMKVHRPLVARLVNPKKDRI